MAVYLFHSSISLATASRGIQYDEALKLSGEGHAVFFLYCGGLMTQCFTNMCGDRAKCRLCRNSYRQEKRLWGKKIKFVALCSLVTPEQKKCVSAMSFAYENIDQIKKLEYKGINIGFGALSNYISESRNLNPLLDNDFRLFFDESLRNSVLTILGVEKAVDLYKPDHMMLYNGRMADNRPVWEMAEQKSIPFTTLEAAYGIKYNFKDRYVGTIPHSIPKQTDMIRYYWENLSASSEAKIDLGRSFFERRRNALYSGDKVYVDKQSIGLLPESWDRSKHNVVIFNSSEDEFAALGDEFDKYALFESQLEGLKFIKEQLAVNTQLKITLRVHPNLTGINYSYVRDLYRLKDERFDVIEADSPVSTYTLLDAADTVVVFGSTMGIESVYWGKPTILLAGAFYYELGCCYIPQTKEEFALMLSKKLEPKEQIKAIMYGYYLLNECREYCSEVDFDWTYWNIKLPGLSKNIELDNWKKLAGSRRLYAIRRWIVSRFLFFTYRLAGRPSERFVLPVKENV